MEGLIAAQTGGSKTGEEGSGAGRQTRGHERQGRREDRRKGRGSISGAGA